VLAAELLLRSGLSRLAPTHDLNALQIAALATHLQPLDDAGRVVLYVPFLEPHSHRPYVRCPAESSASRLEVVVYQHLPVFHTDHCVFCRFLSSGNSFRDCGKPCETNSVHLRAVSDGLDHLVLADQGCRNTVFNAQAQNGAAYIDQFLHSGIRRFRIELVDEPAAFVVDLLNKYRAVLNGEPGAESAVSAFLDRLPNRNGSPQGASEGSLRPQTELKKASMKVTAAEKAAREATQSKRTRC